MTKTMVKNMNLKNEINAYFNKIKETLNNLDREELEILIRILLKAYNDNRQIFICGNGGSALTASHLVCDLNKGASYGRKKRFKTIALTDNVATIMAYANDISYDDVFAEQLKNFLKPGDVVIGISASGNSKNVIKAIKYANKNRGVTIGLSGYDGGRLKKIAKYSVHINKDDMQIVEDVHLIIGHLSMKVLKSTI